MILSKSQKVAQLFLPAAFIHDTEENYQALEELIKTADIGGLTFFHSRHSAAANFEKRAEALTFSGTLEKMISLINRYQSASKIPLLISIDAEYGLAMRIENTPQYPFAITLGGLVENGENLVEEAGFRMGLDLKKAGIHLNFAPCADVNTNPKNPVIGYRSFGPDVEKVSKLALASYRGMKKAGIEGSFKHFPGHGDTHVDSHLGLPVLQKSKDELESEELAPFQYGIGHGVEMIMVGHLAVPSLTRGKEIPASISPEIIKGLLKNEMGFKGLVVSDALNMQAVAKLFPELGELEWKAFEAGNDLLCFSDHVEEGIQKICEMATEETIDLAFEKVQKLKRELGVFAFEKLEVPEFDWDNLSEFQQKLASNYVTLIQGEVDKAEIRKLGASGNLAAHSFFPFEKNVFEEKMQSLIKGNHKIEKNIIALFIPSHKPLNQFGLTKEVINQIQNLAKETSSILVHFGNPLALAHLGDLSAFEAVICGYQNFPEAQEAAYKLLTESK